MIQVPMLDLKAEYAYMKHDIDAAMSKCLEHQKWIFGPEVKELEDKIAHYLNVKHCIGVSSGTEALVLSLRALAIKLKGKEFFDKSDEIITTPFTFTATGDAILRSGATPVFVDIDPSTYNIDANEVNKYLASGISNAVGILPVHLYGRACEMDALMGLAKANNLFVVEDVAQAFGGSWKERKLGSIGTTGAYSFFPSKNLGGFGDGGMISTNNTEMAELIRMLLKHGGRDKYNVDHIGYNARLDTLQAAILLAKFQYLDEFSKRRRAIANRYHEGMKDLPEIMLPSDHHSCETAFDHVYHQYTVRTSKRDKIALYLKERGIITMVYYPFPLHKMKVFNKDRCKIAGNLEKAEQACQDVLSLPMEPLQDDKTTAHIVDCIRSYFK
jgi:UDP-2-acetamido-2-deoxy-ribo-hexuluronate aminotransferase